MVAIVGLVVLMICVFGGFIIAGGSLAPIIKAAPYEMFIIGGAGIGGMITGNSGVILKGAFGGFGRVIKGPKYKKEDYLAVMLLVAKIIPGFDIAGFWPAFWAAVIISITGWIGSWLIGSKGFDRLTGR